MVRVNGGESTNCLVGHFRTTGKAYRTLQWCQSARKSVFELFGDSAAQQAAKGVRDCDRTDVTIGLCKWHQGSQQERHCASSKPATRDHALGNVVQESVYKSQSLLVCQKSHP
eukprot:4340464-Karenia_brevis.AAC.1